LPLASLRILLGTLGLLLCLLPGLIRVLLGPRLRLCLLILPLAALRLLLLPGLLGALLWLGLLRMLLFLLLTVLLPGPRLLIFLLSALFASLCVDGYHSSEKQEDRRGSDYFRSLHTYLL
jgi:hypothetical protein